MPFDTTSREGGTSGREGGAAAAIGSTNSDENGDGAGASLCVLSMATGGGDLQRLTVAVNRIPSAKVVKHNPISAPLEMVDAGRGLPAAVDAT